MQSYAAKVYPEIKKIVKGWQDGVIYWNALSGCRFIFLFRTEEYANLYTIDLLCHGITSSKVFEKNIIMMY